MTTAEVYVALGSNLALPKEQIRQALATLSQHSDLEEFRCSPWYRTAPIGGPADQPDYINAVCSFWSQLPPDALLTLLQNIEQQHGRVRDARWGARTLDLDILWIENFTSDTKRLTVPHPRAHQRAFVLQPWLDLAPGDIRLHQQTLTYWREQCADQFVERLNPREIDVET
ncbi:2-amino-4-hydroxy-6-hydroxymethyldihydropteridine diphosphokinase [Reinekea blandensis]|uniref:2-amino-4-hydroxy-6-hydroxymethyldihydropteridine pyrophosphokinase n=1 Tax=Reinekea blandensis MED297 TaxID=314283 RepID=A4BJA5_9GAMM|nr:2-amino-4-hydroxy-6-hydroxymethyldihydropteridine diphosphokinase [Reinekea blandensis]EAR07763.1 2-amino-4-hydroxy-6-hydroxymethyldihydropteridine-pyrophosphokinase [Reinekea sp. MED297] [Reinekea blandensis MED297]